jgi:parallel beta-helix repeat protein
MHRPHLLSFTIALLMFGCGGESASSSSGADISPAMASSEAFVQQFREALESAEPGDIIDVPAGVHSFKRALTLNTDGVTIRGKGMDKSILSFKGQISGAEGLSVNASDFVIEDLAIEDTIGDALKVNEGENIIIRHIRTEWTNGPDVNTGAYGIYPVQTVNTLIEGSVAIAASDAGIYVGQSKNVIVRNNRAEYNVAGIEVENTIGADVYDNIATNNTGGILVFNMPQIPQRGHSTRVYNNQVSRNNTENFAAPGTAVSGVPKGSGILVNSNDNVEIFNNQLSDNDTANILISSYFSANYAGQKNLAKEFDPYPEYISIYGNTFQGGGEKPGADYLNQIRVALYGPTGAFPDIIWDGIVNPEAATDGPFICVNNSEAKLLNLDAGNNFEGAQVNMAVHDCEVDKLPAIVLRGALANAS